MNKCYKDLLNVLHTHLTALPEMAQLNGQAVLVTGATGLIGSCLIDYLMLHTKAVVYALNRNRANACALFAEYLEQPRFNLLTQDVAQSLPDETTFNFIIHAAGNATPRQMNEDPVGTMHANYLGVDNLLRYAARHHSRIVYLSSGEVYGETEANPIGESVSGYINLLHTRSCYPSSKRAAETLCCCYAAQYGVNVSIARPCYIFGPTYQQGDNRVFVQFCQNVLDGKDIVMKSDGLTTRSYCFVVDCVEALFYILLKGQCAEAYNISGPTTTIRQLAEAVADAVNRKVIVDCPAQPLKGTSPVSRTVLDGRKLETLGWKARYTIPDAARLSLSILKSNDVR